MATLKNLAPYQLKDVATGVSDDQHTVGDEYIGKYGRKYVRGKVLPGTGSVTGRRWSLIVSTSVGILGENVFTFDLTDTIGWGQRFAGVSQGSMLTAVTHFMWIQRDGIAPIQVPATTTHIIAGDRLWVSTTDKTVMHQIAGTTGNDGREFAVAMEKFGVATAVTKRIRLLGW